MSGDFVGTDRDSISNEQAATSSKKEGDQLSSILEKKYQSNSPMTDTSIYPVTLDVESSRFRSRTLGIIVASFSVARSVRAGSSSQGEIRASGIVVDLEGLRRSADRDWACPESVAVVGERLNVCPFPEGRISSNEGVVASSGVFAIE